LKKYLASGQQSEASWERQVKKLAKIGGWLYYHTHRSQFSPAGFPDCVIVKPPRIIFAELKKEGGQPTPEQTEWLELLSQCPGVEVYLWLPSDYEEVKGVLS